MLSCSLICGFLLGVLYDLVQCLCRGRGMKAAPWGGRCIEKIPMPRGGRHHLSDRSKAGKVKAICGTVSLVFSDVGFCLFFAVVMIVLLYYTNDGQFRSSAVAASLIGFGMYRYTLRRLLRPLLLLLRAVLWAVVCWTVVIVTYPVRRVSLWLWSLVAPLAKRSILICSRGWVAFTKRALTILSRIFKPRPQAPVPPPPTLAERIRQTGEIRHGFVSGRKHK
jgi:hypothetical protein